MSIRMKHETMLTHRKRTYAPEAQGDENFCKKRKTSGFSFFFGKSGNLDFFTRLVTCNWDLGFVDTLPRRKFCQNLHVRRNVKALSFFFCCTS